MKPLYFVAPQAALDLVEIWRYIREHSSVAMADRVESVILEKLAFLAKSPAAGHRRKNRAHLDVSLTSGSFLLPCLAGSAIVFDFSSSYSRPNMIGGNICLNHFSSLQAMPFKPLFGCPSEEAQDDPGGSPIVVLMKIRAEGGPVVIDIEQTYLDVSGGADI